MEPGFVACPQCQWPVPAASGGGAGRLGCPRCRQAFTATYFPALFRASERGRAGERLVDDSEAACYFHAARKAVVACEACGRFLCELCDLPVGGRHTCPTCLETGQAPRPGGPAPTRQQSAILYDNVALAMAVLPMLMIYPVVLTAPATLFVVLRYWNRVSSPVPRTRVRFVVAALLALLQMAGVAVLIVALVSS